MTGHLVVTGGEGLRVDCRSERTVTRLLAGLGVGGSGREGPAALTTVHLVVEDSTRPFRLPAADRVTRGVWRDGVAVVLEDACSSGYTLRCEPQGEVLVVRARRRAEPRTRVASALLRQRAALLTRAVLLQYPVMWWAGVHGRAPVHVSALQLGASAPVLAGPSGVGKSTLVETELAAGHRATCDNLATSDGHTVFGIAEPRRTTGGTGARTSHGRRESVFADRLTFLRPDRVIVVSLSEMAQEPSVTPMDADTACRALVTGTYLAGELRRYWGFAAALAAGTGLGPAEPPVTTVARRLTEDLVCLSLTLSRATPARLPDRLGASLR